ncbi:hypothetical protein [Thalassotalea sp. SU-HH00458]|uniref:hypothetical protein n=1 Tax=Thalassotalea sp. SU-HH00458 TaxID=3127657 RepID=UPI0031026CC2
MYKLLHIIILITWGLLNTTSVNATSNKKVSDSDLITIGIPVNEEVLNENDPYFVSLKRAYKALNIQVEFIVLPGARSFKMLEKGKISGSYPRYANLATSKNKFIATPNFNIKENIYAFSLKPIDSIDYVTYTLKYNPKKIGTVRGIKIVEAYVGDQKIHLFNHIDHLIGALKSKKLHLVLETEYVMERFSSELPKLYKSPEPVIKGTITQLLHERHQNIADKLQKYFEEIPIQ